MAPGGKRKRGHSGGGDHYQSSPNHDRRQSSSRDQQDNQNRRNQNNNNNRGRGGSNFGDRGTPGRPQPPRPGSSQSNAQSPRAGQQAFQPPSTPTPAPPPPRVTAPAPIPAPIVQMPATPPVPEVNPSAGVKRGYLWVTPARLEAWSATGHAEVVNEITTAAATNVYEEPTMIVQEVLYAGIDGRISPTLATNVLIDAIKANREAVANNVTRLVITEILLDTLPLYDQHPNLTKMVAPLIPDYIGIGDARLQLQDTLLMALGLVSSTFKNRQVKVHTNILYRVQKYNLSREETEGFAKLITEVFMAEYGRGPLTRVGETLDKVRSLIGCFDLDPNRALDVILDIFANGVVANWRFFVQLLRESEWWPTDAPSVEGPLYQEDDFFDRLERDGFKALCELPDGSDILLQRGGNKVAAQVIGYKFKFYMMKDLDLDSPSHQLPDNLVAMTAILLKIGFISFRDLYPHLSPDDDAMQEDYDEWLKENDSKGRSGAMNALMMASTLPDDTVPPPRPGQGPAPAAEAKKSEEEGEPEEPPAPPTKPRNQKLALLNALLAAGSLPEIAFLFGNYPKIAYPHPEVADGLHRIVHHCIDEVYKPLEPTPGTELGAKKVLSTDPALKQAFAPRQPLVTAPPIKITKYLLPFFPGKEPDPSREYRYFWDPEWTTDLPICKTERDVRVLCLILLRGFSGTRLASDVKLMSKLVRIGVRAVKEHGAASDVGNGWANVVNYLLLPALSVCGSNSAIGNEIYTLMELYSLESRWAMYTFWTKNAPFIFPEVKSKAAEATKDTKNILKRLSTTNMREMARRMSKISYSNPVTAFMVTISQIESYDNLIECVVDSAKHFSKLGFDAFTYAILNKMSEDRGRMQQDGLLVSKWLQALATFCGRLYKRYSELDPTPIIIYIMKKLMQANSADLIVLQEMIKSMAGIVSESNLSDVQIMGLYGSENLRAKILGQLGDKRYSSRESAKRLASALVNNNLAGELLILLGREYKQCIYRSDLNTVPTKVVGNMFDEIHSVINMYMDMLNYTLDFEQWAKAVPTVNEFIINYDVDPEIAWFFCRGHIREMLKREGMLFPEDDKKSLPSTQDAKKKQVSAEKPKNEKSEKNVDADGEIVMADANGEVANNTNTAKDEDVAMADGPSPIAEEEKTSPFSPIMLDLMERLRPSLPDEAWNKISVSFYATFWQLSMYELHCPITPYDEEIKILNNEIVRVIPDKNMSAHSRKRETERLRSQSDRLSQDMKMQIRLQMTTVKRINRESQHWFAADTFHPTKLPMQIIQHCILPRSVLSPHDASFCAKFIKRMHVSGTPKFWTFLLYDNLFGKTILQATIFMSTEREVENYGRFLAEIMADFTSWHRSKATFEKECHGKGNLPGFAKTWGGALLDYEDFRRVLYKWHKQLHAALRQLLQSTSYMHVRNATIVLKHLNKSFPAVDWMGKNLVETVQFLSKNEKREDLKITTTALLSLLKKKEKEWVPVQQFQLSVADGSAKSPANPATSQTGTPAPNTSQEGGQSTSNTLNPTVTSFKPGQSANNGLSQITVHTKSNKEVEDGEIDDLPSAKDNKPDAASNIAGLAPLQPKAVKEISNSGSGRSPTPQPRSQTPSRDSRGRSDSRAPPPRSNELAPSNNGQEQRRGTSPRPPLELFPSKDPREMRSSSGRDEQSRSSGQSKHDDRRERGDSRSENRNVLPQPPSSLPAKPNTPMPPMPRPGSHRPDSDSRGRQDSRESSRRHGNSPRRESRTATRDQLPDLIDELNAKQAQQQRGSGRRPGSDYRSRSPDAGGGRKREGTVQEQRMDNHGDYPRPPAGPRSEVDRNRQSHRESFGGNRPPAGPSDHGRLNQDPNHGRLNQPDTANIPSGPRSGRSSGPSGGSGQNSNFPANSNVPNGPRTGRTSLTLNNRAPGGAPSAPAGSSSSSGQQQQSRSNAAMPMHPDRARGFNDDKNGPPTVNTNFPASSSSSNAQNNHGRSNSANSPTGNVHPSRLAVIGLENTAPSGPRNELPSPTGPSGGSGGGGGSRAQGGGGSQGRDNRRESLDHHHDRRRARGLQDILASGGGGVGSPGSNVPSEPGQSGRRRGRGNTQGGQQQQGSSGQGQQQSNNNNNQSSSSGQGGSQSQQQQQGVSDSTGGNDDGRRRDQHRERDNGRENRERDRDRDRDRDQRDRDRDRDRGDRDRDQRKAGERGSGNAGSGGSGQQAGGSGGGQPGRDRDRDRGERGERERPRDRDRDRDREGRDHGRETRDRGGDRERGDRRGRGEWPQGPNNAGGPQKRPHRDGGDSRGREDAKRPRTD
ncbi:THO complex subunit 2 [Orbilia blumenaviensis]|uniref:THO complex subunit 2 n=1 Tax=Orbilia blumenaviensis TaxID=1796055 RepID=A0AAV9U688_9PEZI